MTRGAARPPMRRHRLPRRARLKRQRLIRPLFDSGREEVRSTRVGPLTARSRVAPREELGHDVPVQIGFAVGRRTGDQPTRNRIKRIMRETYRIYQHDLVDLFADRPDALTVMVLFRGRPDGAAESIRRCFPALLGRLAEAHREAPAEPK